MPEVIDLDAKREARLAQKETTAETDPPVVRWKGQEWRLPPGPMPGQLVIAIGDLSRGDMAGMKDALVALFSDEQPTDENGDPLTDERGRPVPSPFRRFMATKPDLNDLTALIEGAAQAYGEDPGNLPDSSGSSPNIGTPSSPTSPGTTESTPATSGVEGSPPAAPASS